MGHEANSRYSAKQGVTVYFDEVNEEKGILKMVLDDTLLSGSEDLKTWKHRSLFTFYTWDIDRLENGRLTDADFMGIGKTLIARLVAFRKVRQQRRER